MKKKIAIILVHYGKLSVTKACVASLIENEKYPYILIIINNTSDTLSPKDFSNKSITVVNNEKNIGFAPAVNIGIKEALSKKADAILLLNNDTKIEMPFLKHLVDILFSQKSIGIVGPAINFIKAGKRIYDLGGYMTWFGKTYHEEVVSIKNMLPHEVTYVTGAALLIKSEILKKVGLFDEDFFLYYEDADFCLRAKKSGSIVFVDPQVSIKHALSKTTGKMSPLATYHQTKSAVIFGRKYMKNLFQKIAHFIFLLTQSMWITAKNPQSGLTAWKALFTTSRIFQWSMYLLGICLLTYVTFWNILSFTFWKDDWSLLWSTLYDIKGYHGYFNHPGTPIEFFLLTPLFRINPFPWMLFGLFLRILNSLVVGIFAHKITNSREIGFLSGIFFAVSYAGAESLHFVSAQVTALALIPLCLTGVFYIKLLEENKKYIVYFLIFILITFLIDPPRTVPVIFTLPLLALLKRNAKNYSFVINLLKKFYVGFIVLGIPLFIAWFIFLSPGTLLAKLFAQLPNNPKIIFQKWYELHHFSAAIGNLFIGWFYRMRQDDQNTGIYTKFFAVIGYLFALIGAGSLVAFLKTKKRVLGIISFCIVWAFLFYLPNWLSEPRAPMAAPHRYLLIPSIGLIVLVAYFLSQFKQKTLFILCSAVFIFLNIYQANRILAYQSTYRSAAVVKNIWEALAAGVPHGQEYDSIWMVSGKEPWVSEDVLLAGSAPLALMRMLTNSNKLPMMTNDPHIALQFLCHDNLPQINRWNIVLQKNRVHISHIYAWRISNGGIVTNVSLERRQQLGILAKKEQCIPYK